MRRKKKKLPFYPISREDFDRVFQEFLCSEGAKAVDGIVQDGGLNWTRKGVLCFNVNLITPFYGDHLHRNISLRKLFNDFWELGLYEDDMRSAIKQLRAETDRLERRLDWWNRHNQKQERKAAQEVPNAP